MQACALIIQNRLTFVYGELFTAHENLFPAKHGETHWNCSSLQNIPGLQAAGVSGGRRAGMCAARRNSRGEIVAKGEQKEGEVSCMKQVESRASSGMKEGGNEGTWLPSTTYHIPFPRHLRYLPSPPWFPCSARSPVRTCTLRHSPDWSASSKSLPPILAPLLETRPGIENFSVLQFLSPVQLALSRRAARGCSRRRSVGRSIGVEKRFVPHGEWLNNDGRRSCAEELFVMELGQEFYSCSVTAAGIPGKVFHALGRLGQEDRGGLGNGQKIYELSMECHKLLACQSFFDLVLSNGRTVLVEGRGGEHQIFACFHRACAVRISGLKEGVKMQLAGFWVVAAERGENLVVLFRGALHSGPPLYQLSYRRMMIVERFTGESYDNLFCGTRRLIRATRVFCAIARAVRVLNQLQPGLYTLASRKLLSPVRGRPKTAASARRLSSLPDDCRVCHRPEQKIQLTSSSKLLTNSQRQEDIINLAESIYSLIRRGEMNPCKVQERIAEMMKISTAPVRRRDEYVQGPGTNCRNDENFNSNCPEIPGGGGEEAESYNQMSQMLSSQHCCTMEHKKSCSFGPDLNQRPTDYGIYHLQSTALPTELPKVDIVDVFYRRKATSCGYNSSHPVWHALYECLQDIHGDSSPFLLQPFHELSNGFWPRLTSPRPAIQFVPKMFYRDEVGALGGPFQSANIVVGVPLHSSP
ncbi:hypothetical protein PR048_030072 [Dryococelus australis]|uniref:Uncharacterized protein n=1 Tax=Dryococelus australis TaxID=614101 RepID=A0ABQ9G7X5_9NEOP|nr:hypothetical protein PR048_030072 [Dryococelus australis]